MSEDLSALLAAVDLVAMGRRIRQARVVAGLTQGQLVGDDASVGYLSRIESGQRRPDLGLLERLAARLGTNALVLLTGLPDPALSRLQVAVDHAELALRGGTPEDALARLDEAWAEVAAADVPELRRRARFTRALTFEALGRLDEAIVELEDHLEESQDGSGVDAGESVRTAVALSRCYRESGDLARAIDTGERQLDELRRLGLDGSAEAVQLVVTVAAAHFGRGDIAHAARMCRRAIDKAEALDSPVAMASAYWNASIVECERGAVHAAVPLAARALQLLESAEDNRSLARLRSELGILQLRLDPPEIEAAKDNFAAAEEQMRWSSASVVDLGRNAVAMARAELLSGEVDAAEKRASAVLTEVREASPELAVDALLVLGQAAATRDDASGAAAYYRQAVLVLTSLGSDREAAQAWFELGHLLEQLGLEREANQAYRSAAASTGLVTVPSPIGDRTS